MARDIGVEKELSVSQTLRYSEWKWYEHKLSWFSYNAVALILRRTKWIVVFVLEWAVQYDYCVRKESRASPRNVNVTPPPSLLYAVGGDWPSQPQILYNAAVCRPRFLVLRRWWDWITSASTASTIVPGRDSLDWITTKKGGWRTPRQDTPKQSYWMINQSSDGAIKAQP